MSFSFGFNDQTLVITGAAGGIGSETVRVFAAGGANVVLADISLERLEDTARRLGLQEDKYLLVEYDASSRDSAESLVSQAVEKFGSIDHLVPCAGIYRDRLVEDMTPEEWNETLRINLDGVYWVTRAAIPHLSPGASIVNVSSVSAYRGSALHAHYSAAKAGVLGLARSLVLELGARKIRVNSVSPGIIDTPMTQGLLKRRGEELIAMTPLGRNGKPEETASVIAFLSSSAASFVNGENIHINGGQYF